MARPLRIEYSCAFYHVTSRGNEQKDIFKSQRDREKFLGYLAWISTDDKLANMNLPEGLAAHRSTRARWVFQ